MTMLLMRAAPRASSLQRYLPRQAPSGTMKVCSHLFSYLVDWPVPAHRHFDRSQQSPPLSLCATWLFHTHLHFLFTALG